MKSLFSLLVIFSASAALANGWSRTSYSATIDLAGSYLDKSPLFQQKFEDELDLTMPTSLEVVSMTSAVDVDYGDPDLSNQPITYTCHTTAKLESSRLEMKVFVRGNGRLFTATEMLTASVTSSKPMENESSTCEPSLTGNEHIFLTGDYNNPLKFNSGSKDKPVLLQLQTVFLWADGQLKKEDGVLSFENVLVRKQQVNGVQWFAFVTTPENKKLTLSNIAPLALTRQSVYPNP